MSQVFHDIEKKILETLQKTPNQSPEQLTKNTEERKQSPQRTPIEKME